MAITLAAFAACPALARTVTVASCDRATGETTLSISAAEAGDGAKALFAAWSPSSIADIADASETAYVGVVAASDTEKSYSIPSEWLGKVGFVSFFLMADALPYDTLLTYIRSTSTSPICMSFPKATQGSRRRFLDRINKIYRIKKGME